MNLLPAQSEQLANSLPREIAGDAYFDRYHRALYSTDASIYSIEPLGVVLPRTARDVTITVQMAAELGVPLVPRGGGTSLSGQSIGRGIVLDFSKFMNRILDIDADASTARIEPGVVLEQLNREAASRGLQFGPDVATINRANLGGMIGNNSAGARSILHGKTVDHVIQLEAVLSDGSSLSAGWIDDRELARRQQLATREGHIYREVVRTIDAHRQAILDHYPRLLRRVSGYNLDEFVPECRRRMPWPSGVQRVRRIESRRYEGCHFNLAKLLVGAEGSLGTITEAVVHLVPLPRCRGMLVLEFDSLAHAIDAVGTILASQPSAIELIDKMILELAAENVQYRNYLDFVTGRPESLILAEFSGDHPDEVRRRVESLAAALSGRAGLSHMLPALKPRLCDHIWACRKAALPLLMGIPGNRKPIAFVEDTTVDPPRLPEFVARFQEIIHRAGTRGAFYGHASVGCLHIRPLIDTKNRDDLARMRRILDEISDLVLEFGGAMSGEHGDGLARSWLNEKLFGPELYRAFQAVKHAFDPAGLMNPGKVVDGPDPAENLRLGPGDKPEPVVTVLDFSRQGGFASAAELCNGSGVCRKRATGTMCPSFMATGDEEHSTRGRANALRSVLSGALPGEGLGSDALYGTFDLCLQCKGCKVECPSNVDVAKLKSEFLSQFYRRRGIPWGVRAMAQVARINRLGAALAPVSNWAARLPGAAWFGEQLLGVDRRRPLPRFERRHFRRWFDHRASQPGPARRGPVVLLDDCLTSYCEPQVNRAAVKVLEAAGFEVHRAGLLCCGRAMISKGLLDVAQQLARDNLKLLLPWAERGVPIVGCEPSCLLTLSDDYLDLVPGDAAQQVAAHTRLIDSFLIEQQVELPLCETGECNPNGADRSRSESATPARAVLHGHCHQKALVGTADTVAALKMAGVGDVQVIDSGCCGMAGSFGYEHYDLSMAIAERVLLPAIRQSADATIIAPGFSCRHQIQHGTGRQAQHPIQFLAARIADD